MMYLKANNLNILKVSRLTGIANSTLYAWRDDKVPLTSAKLNLIADKLNVSVDYLLDKTADPTPIPALPDPPEYGEYIEQEELTLQEKRALELFRKLNQEQSEQTIKIMEQLAKLNDMVNSYGERAKENMDKINHAKQ